MLLHGGADVVGHVLRVLAVRGVVQAGNAGQSGVGSVGAMVDRVSPGVMLLDLSDSGYEVPTPGSWPGRTSGVVCAMETWAMAA